MSYIGGCSRIILCLTLFVGVANDSKARARGCITAAAHVSWVEFGGTCLAISIDVGMIRIVLAVALGDWEDPSL